MGSGTEVSEVNKLLKMHRQMADVMKQMKKGGRGLMSALFGGNAPQLPPGALGGMGGMGGGGAGGLPGLGGMKLPPGFAGKKK
jgi:signal recognition particle subunit SRP54